MIKLLNKAEELKNDLSSLYQQSLLPDNPDVDKIDQLLIEMRKEYYKED